MVSFFTDKEGKTRLIAPPQHSGLLSSAILNADKKPSKLSKFVSAKNTTKKAIELARQKKKEIDEKKKEQQKELDESIDSILDADSSESVKFRKLQKLALDNWKKLSKPQQKFVNLQLRELDKSRNQQESQPYQSERKSDDSKESENQSKSDKPEESGGSDRKPEEPTNTFGDLDEAYPEPKGERIPVGSTVQSEKFGELEPAEVQEDDRLKEYVTFAKEGRD